VNDIERKARILQFFEAFRSEAAALAHQKIVSRSDATAISSAFARIAADVALPAQDQREVELERMLVAQLCHAVLEWYHGDNDLMPQVLVDRLTAEAQRLIGKDALTRTEGE